MSTVDNRFPTEGTQVDILAALLQIKSAIQGDVNWSQVLSSGTTIATITIGENSYTVYAPTPPTKTSDITNDSGFITNTVNNLVNYYLKTDTYTKTEVNNLISALTIINFEVVQTLPTTNISTSTIYLVPKSTAQTNNVYDEYINTDGTTAGWEKIGDTKIDLSNYYTKSEADTLLNGKVDKVAGKGLSTEDYTSSEKTKLSGIESGAEVNVQSDWSQSDNTADDYIKNKPSSEVKTATDTFTTVNGGLLEECNIELEPVQDLHGYDHPWVGGAGKNSFVSATAKTEEQNNVKIWTDGDGIYHINGTPTATTTILFPLKQGFTIPPSSTHHFYLGNDFDNIGVTLSLMNGSTQVDNLTCTPANKDSDSYSVMANKYIDGVRVIVQSGVSLSNVSIAPMLLLDTETDTSYASWDNICPISGHTEVDLLRDGKNLLPMTVAGIKSANTSGSWVGNVYTLNSIDYTINTDANGNVISIVANGTASGQASLFFPLPSLIDGTSYILSGCPSGGSNSKYRVSFSNTTLGIINEYGSGSTFTYESDSDDIIYARIYSGYTATNLAFYPMIRLATETDPTFEPYHGHLYQVQIGSTVYGGYVDLVSGVMVANKAMIDLSTISSWSDASGGRKTSSAIMNVAKAPETTEVNCECDSYKPCSSSDLANDPTLIGIGVNSGKLIVVRTADGNAPSSGILCYELATPQIIQLTPQQIETLVGENHLSTPLDGQSIDSVKYREVFAFDDVEKVVSLRVPISMIGTDESGRTTASQAYASGDYFYKDGYMCKALTSISAGATLTLNTNYSQGTLADILKAIENA